MRTMLTMMVVAMVGASTAMAGEPVVMDECLRSHSVARQNSSGDYEVTTTLAWGCDAAFLGSGIVKLRINNEPVADALAWDGTAPLTVRTTVPRSEIGYKVCATAAGYDTNGEPSVIATRCVVSTEVATTPAVPSAPTRAGKRQAHPRL